MDLMKCFLSITLLTTIVYSAPAPKLDVSEIQDAIDGIHGTCTNLWGVTDDQVTNYEFSDKSKQMMCYMKCLLIESKWFNTKEELQMDGVSYFLTPHLLGIILPTIEICKSKATASSNECETSYNFHLCLRDTDPENYFLA